MQSISVNRSVYVQYIIDSVGGGEPKNIWIPIDPILIMLILFSIAYLACTPGINISILINPRTCFK